MYYNVCIQSLRVMCAWCYFTWRDARRRRPALNKEASPRVSNSPTSIKNKRRKKNSEEEEEEKEEINKKRERER